MGHAVRCLNLAHGCATQGASIFLLIDPTTHGLIQTRLLGQETIINFDPALRLPIAFDKNATLVIDSYDLDEAFEEHYRAQVRFLFVIDDLANRHHACTYLLDQTIHCPKDKYQGLTPETTRHLLGADYALISERFVQGQKSIAPAHPPFDIALTLGGSDPDNVSAQVLNLLEERDDLGTVHMIVGTANPHVEDLHALTQRSAHNICLHQGLNDLAPVLGQCDVAIAAGGVNALERCALGLPSLLIEIADNQRDMIAALAHAGAGISLGTPDKLTAATLNHALTDILQGQAFVKMQEACLSLCDGKGVKRVADILMGSHR